MHRIDPERTALVRRLVKVLSQALHVTFDPAQRNRKNKRVVDLFGISRIALPEVSRDEPENLQGEPKIHFVTLIDGSSYRNGKANSLLASYRKWGVAPIVLEGYDARIGNWSKITAFHDFLFGDAIDDGDIIVFTDATDVIAVSPDVADFRTVLSHYDVDILYGAENRFAKASSRQKAFFDDRYKQTGSPYVNAGFVVGRKRHLQAFYGYLYNILRRMQFVSLNGSEQAVVVYGIVNCGNNRASRVRIGIDFESRCVLTINSVTAVPAQIDAAFVHVTSQREPKQADKWARVLERFGAG